MFNGRIALSPQDIFDKEFKIASLEFSAKSSSLPR